MSHLSIEEALRVSDAFFMTLYGIDVYEKWKQMKVMNKFDKEPDFITWIMEGGSVSRSQPEMDNDRKHYLSSTFTSYLSMEEALRVGDAFLMTLYGVDIYDRWKDLKQRMNFDKETDFISWVLDQFTIKPASLTPSQEGVTLVKCEMSDGEDECEDGVRGDDEQQQAPAATRSPLGVDHHKVKSTTFTSNSSVIPIKIIVNTGCTDAESQTGKHYTVENVLLNADGYNERKPTAGKVDHEYYHLRQTSNGEDCFVNEQQYFNLEQRKASGRKRGVAELSQSAAYRGSGGGRAKKFQCDQCPYKTGRRGDLGKHYRTHTGEKPFACQWCPKSFNVSSNLNAHINAIHQELKTLACAFCDYQTSVKQSFRRHLVRRHGYSSNYKCGECNKFFYSTPLLRAHLKKHDTPMPTGNMIVKVEHNDGVEESVNDDTRLIALHNIAGQHNTVDVLEDSDMSHESAHHVRELPGQSVEVPIQAIEVE